MCNRRMKIGLGAAIAMLGATGILANDYALDWWTVDNGGQMFSTGGGFELAGTIGQPDAGAISGGEFELSGGFWFPLPLDDCNSDGWVDLIDYGDFEECLSGPNTGLSQPQCNCFDRDGDNDVDLVDIGQFQSAFTRG